jgi:hypothetical protein
MIKRMASNTVLANALYFTQTIACLVKMQIASLTASTVV